MSQLKQEFEARIKAALDQCHQLKYHPTDFEGMLRNASAVLVAEKLVLSGQLQTGLKKLAQMNRLDLSVESIMLEPQFASIFKADHLHAARWRLEQVKR